MGITNSLDKTMKMSESSVLAQILAYMDENKLIGAIEVESQEMMVVKAIKFEKFKFGHNGQERALESRRLEYIYDNKPLEFEKDPLTSTRRMQARDPLEEIDLKDRLTKRPTYISVKPDPT